MDIIHCRLHCGKSRNRTYTSGSTRITCTLSIRAISPKTKHPQHLPPRNPILPLHMCLNKTKLQMLDEIHKQSNIFYFIRLTLLFRSNNTRNNLTNFNILAIDLYIINDIYLYYRNERQINSLNLESGGNSLIRQK